MTEGRMFAAPQPKIHLQRSVADYAVAVAAPVGVTLFRSFVAADPVAGTSFLPYLLAVTLSAWRGGLWPGLAATLFSALLGSSLLIEPVRDQIVPVWAFRFQLVLFVAIGGLISVLCEQLHRSRGIAEGDTELALAHQQELEREVAERKRAEEALRENEERLRMALEASSTVAWDWNLATGITERSATSRQVLGLRSGPMAQHLELIHPDDLPKVHTVLRRALRGEGTYDLEYRVMRADGETRWVADVGNLVYDVDGQPERMVGCLRDITLLKEAELDQQRTLSALAEADQRKDEFLAILAHELRNPLAPIRSSVRILQTGDDVASSQQRHLSVIDRQVGNMARLLDDLLDVSRITRGVVQLKTEPLDLHEVLVDAIEGTRPFLRAQDHDLTVDLSAEPLPVCADRLRLEQVFVNLLNNAAKYTDAGGKIALSVSVEAPPAESPEDTRSSALISWAVVRITDNGRGISPSVLSRVFDLFVQGEQGFNRTHGGLGIGLTMVRRLIEMHGGRVEAHSPGLGQGSTFTVRLPLRKDARGTMKHEVGRTVGSGSDLHPSSCIPRPSETVHPSSLIAYPDKMRVLVVDDNRDGAEALAEILEFWGHETWAVFDGPAALRALTDLRPQVVICDLGMPGMDGFEVARRIPAEADPALASDLVLIALTGYGREEDRVRTREAGFHHHLIKPVNPDELQALMEALGVGR